MSEHTGIGCRMVEFHRFGRERSIFLSPDHAYIRATGYDELATPVQPELDQEELLRLLNQLRYAGAAGGAERDARDRLAKQAVDFLPLPKNTDDGLMQIDLVTNAAELWAFPFEACYAAHEAWLSDAERGVVLTRRIRGGFADQTPPWPTRPRVLFAHAPATRDLEKSLVDQHVDALRKALDPWITERKPLEQHLAVREVLSAADLAGGRAEFKPSYIHILAHGAPTERDPRLPDKTVWGIRLGYENVPGVSPADIAKALEPLDGAPLVVTVAACDSANQSQILYASYSVVQELHRHGVPVVIGSQLPLTKAGSVELTREFYGQLLKGADVRLALHAGRVALHRCRDAGHDWLSLVGYVRLPPEGYAQHLKEFGLRAELGMLDAIQTRADRLSAEGGTPDEFTTVEARLRDRLASLEKRGRNLDPAQRQLSDECNGLLASAYKRLAELRFIRSRQGGDARDRDLEASRKALCESLERYRSAFQSSMNSHWLGVQQLALGAALHRRFSRPEDWQIVRWVAERERDSVMKDGRKDFWSCGTLAEIWLLAPIAGQPRDLDAARDAITRLRERSRGEDFPVASTRRQLNRYVTWWTNANGFFPGGEDLAKDAAQLVALLAQR
jgi:hypothetical protein